MSKTVDSELLQPPRIGSGGPTDPAHDAQLRRGILHTDVSRIAATALTGSFLLLIYGIPAAQAALELREDETPVVLDLFARAPTAENLRHIEHDLEQASYAKELVQPHVQLWLSRFGRAGNQRAVIGREGFLFYTPGITHLAGPSFLDEDFLAQRRAAAEDAEQPDPRPAIHAFAQMLALRGIRLVLFPVPDKAALQPRQLHGRTGAASSWPVPHNVGWPAFTADLRAHGVTLFDPTPAQLHAQDPSRFMQQDTHWTPAWMQSVAGSLAQLVTRVGALPPLATDTPRRYHSVGQSAERVGDLVDMLKLPDDQQWLTPRTIHVEQVRDAAGELWEPDPNADVLLLGDSFTNVFSQDHMGWGEAAGLGPHLSLALARPVDVIAQNDSGAFATRQLLARALDAGQDRLAGKRVVIWELAARELSVGDWRQIDWPAPTPSSAPQEVP